MMDISYKQIKIIARQFGYTRLQNIKEEEDSSYTASESHTGKLIKIHVPVPFDKNEGNVEVWDPLKQLWIEG